MTTELRPSLKRAMRRHRAKYADLTNPEYERMVMKEVFGIESKD